MFITTNQMSIQHELQDEQFKICCNHILLKRQCEWRLLGVTSDKNLTLNHLITSIRKLLLIFEYSKKAQKIHVTVSTQVAGRITDLFKTHQL